MAPARIKEHIYQQSQQKQERDITHHIASGWFWQPSIFLNNIKIDKFVLLHSLHQKQQALKMVSLKNNKHRLTRGQIRANKIKNSSIIAQIGQLELIQRANIQIKPAGFHPPNSHQMNDPFPRMLTWPSENMNTDLI